MCARSDSGQFQNVTGSTTCGICPPGTRSDAGAGVCTECAAGKYRFGATTQPASVLTAALLVCVRSSQSGSVFCKGCGVGSYSSASGASGCTGCGPGRLVQASLVSAASSASDTMPRVLVRVVSLSAGTSRASSSRCASSARPERSLRPPTRCPAPRSVSQARLACMLPVAELCKLLLMFAMP